MTTSPVATMPGRTTIPRVRDLPDDMPRRARADRLKRRITADLARASGPWFERMGTFGRIQRNVRRLNALLRELGYVPAQLATDPRDTRQVGESMHAWRNGWLDDVSAWLGALFRPDPVDSDAWRVPTTCGRERRSGPIRPRAPLPVPVPVPSAEPRPPVPVPSPAAPPSDLPGALLAWPRAL